MASGIVGTLELVRVVLNARYSQRFFWTQNYGLAIFLLLECIIVLHVVFDMAVFHPGKQLRIAAQRQAHKLKKGVGLFYKILGLCQYDNIL